MSAPQGPSYSQQSAPLDRQVTPPLPSEAVLRGQSAVEIEHNGQVYRLQTTRQGKLILTK